MCIINLDTRRMPLQVVDSNSVALMSLQLQVCMPSPISYPALNKQSTVLLAVRLPS